MNQPLKSRRSDERGSMFLLALVALSVLTIIGLSLAVVTETEMLLGANEWVITETHFAAEAGLTTQISQLLVANDTQGVDVVIPSYFGAADDSTFFLPDQSGGGAGGGGVSTSKEFYRLGFDVKSTGLLPVTVEEMPYSKANEGASDRFYAGFFYTLTRSQRTAWRGDYQSTPTCDDLDRSLLGQKHITNGFYYSPMGALQAEAMINVERAGIDSSTGNNFCDDFAGPAVSTLNNTL
ncbi:MAG: hypothetical protein AAF725_00605 [Acidobacteriota bacterium]